ncbi:MAG: hypothetical protein IJ702_07730 [Fretibacterium sp.]|nr:hypothetical protein [Fretibacterium sp.]
MAGLRDSLARHFLKQAEVWGGSDLSLDAPGVYTLRRSVAAHPLRFKMPLLHTSALPLGQRRQPPASNGFRFSPVSAKARGERVRRYTAKNLKVFSAPLKNLGRLKVHNGLNRMRELPQERTNRLKWQTHRPKEPGEAILAWYGPLIEDAVIKLTLDKARGTLLVWYDPQPRHSRTGGLYLYRRMGAGEKLEWRWV